MMQTKQKNLKPIDIDLHLKYECPESTCGQNHWLSLKETQIKNFKIVCDCGLTFSPKRISNINIKYNKKSAIKQTLKTPIDLEQKCIKLLISYGFTQDESLSLVYKAWATANIDTPTGLVKFILQNLGDLNK